MIQIDMPMPTNCLDCPACNEYLTCAIPINGRKWGENDVREFGQGRPEWCPMKEQEVEEQISDAIHETAKQFRQTIIRCKDCEDACIYSDDWVICTHIDSNGNDKHPANWFCADGRRRNDNA